MLSFPSDLFISIFYAIVKGRGGQLCSHEEQIWKKFNFPPKIK